MLVTCSECGYRVSSLADECNNCGFPIKKYKKQLVQKEEESIQTEVLFREKEEIQNKISEEIQNKISEVDRKFKDEHFQLLSNLVKSKIGSSAHILAKKQSDELVIKKLKAKRKVIEGKEAIVEIDEKIKELERRTNNRYNEEIKTYRIKSLNNWGCFTEIIIWTVIINTYSINESMGLVLSMYLFLRLLFFIWMKFKYL